MLRPLSILSLSFVLLASACGGSGGGDVDAGPDKADIDPAARLQLVSGIAERVIVPAIGEVASRADALETAARAYAADPSDENREAARAAYASFQEAWQRAEVMHMGPAGSSEAVRGGQDLRASISTWPRSNLCLVDRAMVVEEHDDAEAVGAYPAEARGIVALEYLLYFEGTTNACADSHAINQAGIDGRTWAGIADALTDRRAALAGIIAASVADGARALEAAWAPEGGNFLAQVTSAGNGSETYETALQAMNGLSDAMFYLDLEVKDMKLAVPAGVSMDCLLETCPDARESRFANLSLEHLKANAEAFQTLFLGGPVGTEAAGFDDLLRDIGATGLADRMVANIAAMRDAMQALEGTLLSSLSADVNAVRAAYDAVKAVTDDVKNDFFACLSLDRPLMGGSDTD